MATQNSGGQRGQRQKSGNDPVSKNSGGQRGRRQEAGNDHSTKNNHRDNSGNVESDPEKKK